LSKDFCRLSYELLKITITNLQPNILLSRREAQKRELREHILDCTGNYYRSIGVLCWHMIQERLRTRYRCRASSLSELRLCCSPLVGCCREVFEVGTPVLEKIDSLELLLVVVIDFVGDVISYISSCVAPCVPFIGCYVSALKNLSPFPQLSRGRPNCRGLTVQR
jgi:hypothetical protein